MDYDVIIANGVLISAEGETRADVAIRGETIAAVGPGLAASGRGGAEVIDAKGRHVIPGGVDVHVHLELPFCGTVSSDDWNTGTRAAARGGVTTVIDFAIPYGEESLLDAYNNWMARARPKACIDYCFHMAITNWDRHGPQMETLVGMGCPTFKEFMIYASEGWQSDDRAIYNTLERCRELGAMLLVHAESSRVLDELIARRHTPELMRKYRAPAAPDDPAQLHRGRGDPAGDHLGRGDRRPTVHRPHVNRRRGRDRQGGAGPRRRRLCRDLAQYLVLDDSAFEGPDGHLFACCPQIKKKKDQERLWQGLKDGEVSVVSTDTCTFSRAQKARWEGDWTKIPMGLPGLETLLPIVYTHGVLGGRLTPSEFVAKCCTNPSRLMGLYPRKGVIAVGSDADLAIIDPEKRIEVDHRTMETNADWSPYQGWSLAGFAEKTFCRGRKIVEDYRFVGESGWGRWLPRERAGSLDGRIPAGHAAVAV